MPKHYVVRIVALGAIIIHALMEMVGFCPIHFG